MSSFRGLAEEIFGTQLDLEPLGCVEDLLMTAHGNEAALLPHGYGGLMHAHSVCEDVLAGKLGDDAFSLGHSERSLSCNVIKSITENHLPDDWAGHIPLAVGIGDRIAKARKEKGWSQAKLAQALNVGQSTVAQWENGTNEPPNDKVAKIAKLTGSDASFIAFGGKPSVEELTVDNHQSTVAAANQTSLAFPPGAQTLHSWPKDLKIIGHVRAGVDGVFLDQGEIHGMAYRPPQLLGVPNAFAVYVHDESMVPAFKPGRIAWVHPTRPVAPGDDVVVEMTDGQAFIKELVRRNERHVICKQWNPIKEVRFDKIKVKRVYYVVGSYKED